jgi:hypothetical protein
VHFQEDTQSEILRCAQDDTRGEFFRSLLGLLLTYCLSQWQAPGNSLFTIHHGIAPAPSRRPECLHDVVAHKENYQQQQEEETGLQKPLF